MSLELFARLAAQFPDAETAPPDEPLAGGGDLSPTRLLAAYSLGIFPWYSEDLPILWHSPDPRAILPLDAFHLPGRSARKLAKHPFETSLNRDFFQVMSLCGATRPEGTWITKDMLLAYMRLHKLGYAHSIEVWRDGELVGGLYGLAIGKAFFGESMFHLESEASRAALKALVSLLRQQDFRLLDIQQESPHMMAMGAIEISRSEYLKLLAAALGEPDFSRPGALCPWPSLPKTTA